MILTGLEFIEKHGVSAARSALKNKAASENPYYLHHHKMTRIELNRIYSDSPDTVDGGEWVHLPDLIPLIK